MHVKFGILNEHIYYYIYIFLCPLTRVWVVYIVKEVASFWGAHFEVYRPAETKAACSLRRNWN